MNTKNGQVILLQFLSSRCFRLTKDSKQQNGQDRKEDAFVLHAYLPFTNNIDSEISLLQPVSPAAFHLIDPF